MKQRTLHPPNSRNEHRSSKRKTPASQGPGHEDIAWLLAQMTFPERVRAYRTQAFSRRELACAAARHPEQMPLLNGEFEWLVVDLADAE